MFDDNVGRESVAVRSLTIALCGIGIGVLAACSAAAVPRKEALAASKPAVPVGGLLLTGAGATFPSVLYDKWFSVYQEQHRDRAVGYEAVGSGEGVRRFLGKDVADDERVDFGASDAALRDEEIASVPGGVVLLPVTAGSVALAYNLPGVAADLRLSRQAYADIFAGRIKTWSDPRIAVTNPGIRLPNLTLTTVVRQDASGTAFAFTKHLDAISDVWRSTREPATLTNWPGSPMRASGNEGVAARIKQSTGAVGYVSYEFARRAGLQVALLQNRAGRFIGPSPGSASVALEQVELPENLRLYVPDPTGPEAYPIVTLTWILLRRNSADPLKAQALHDLFRWCLTDGQQYAAELGYAPLPQSIITRSLAALDR